MTRLLNSSTLHCFSWNIWNVCQIPQILYTELYTVKCAQTCMKSTDLEAVYPCVICILFLVCSVLSAALFWNCTSHPHKVAQWILLVSVSLGLSTLLHYWFFFFCSHPDLVVCCYLVITKTHVTAPILQVLRKTGLMTSDPRLRDFVHQLSKSTQDSIGPVMMDKTLFSK